MEEKKKSSGGSGDSMFSQLPPKFAFWAGVVTASAVWAIVALVIVLVVMFGDGGTSAKKTTTKSNTNTTTTTTDTAAAQDSIDMDTLRNNRGEGEITIVEYSDYDCPFCQRFHPTMLEVMEQFDGQVAWSFKHFPLTSLHPNAEDAAVASECAAAQDKFWEFTDLYMDSGSGITATGDDKIAAVAEQVGANMDDFNNCLEDTDVRSQVRSDATEAQALGGRGTPFSVIVDKDGNVLSTIPGALQTEAVAQTLEGLLN